MTEYQFTHDFWNDKFSDLNKINNTVQNVSDSKDAFAKKIEEISKNHNATSFACNFTPSGSVRISIGLNLGIGMNFALEIAADPMGKKAQMKGAYLELNILHENCKEFLSNTFLPFLPYTAIEELLNQLENIQKEYSKKLLEVKKQAKLNQMSAALIKSLLTKKLQKTRFEWKLSENGDGSFLVRIKDREETVETLVVTENNCMEKIMGLDL